MQAGLLARRIALILACAAAAAWTAPANAADFYVAGNLGFNWTSAEADGSTDFFALSGSDGDSAPVYGGAMGFGFAFDEPRDRIAGFDVPEWKFRVEIEGAGGRDFELRTDGGDGFFTEVESWSLVNNVYFDVPVSTPVEWLFGRVPILEPLYVYAGGGVGLGHIDVETTDNFSLGKESEYRFTWQAGLGLSYEVTDRFTVSLGYRYYDIGDVTLPLLTAPDSPPFGELELALESHEFVSSLRIDFYSLLLPEY